MAQTIVLVTFYSRGGATERLAHAAAVGAVQARGLIRLRRVPDADPEAVLARFPEARGELQRMHREYVAPREADVLAADALIFASTETVDAFSPEWSEYVGLLDRLHAEGRLAGKVAAAIGNGRAFDSLSSVIRRLGLVAVGPDDAGTAPADDTERAVALGRRVVAAAQSARR